MSVVQRIPRLHLRKGFCDETRTSGEPESKNKATYSCGVDEETTSTELPNASN